MAVTLDGALTRWLGTKVPTGTPVAAPEVARSRALAVEHTGDAMPECRTYSGIGVLALVLERSDVELSATETLEQAFSDADSLATLSRIWTDLTAGEYRCRLLGQVGRAMDERISRLGEHVADTMPLWAERTLGPLPHGPVQRQDWLNRAAAIEPRAVLTCAD